MTNKVEQHSSLSATDPSDNKDSISSNEHQKAQLKPLRDQEFKAILEGYSLETLVECKIHRFLEQLDSHFPEDLYDLVMKTVEKPLLKQILRQTGGNQVQASKILGMNRATLKKKMKFYGFC